MIFTDEFKQAFDTYTYEIIGTPSKVDYISDSFDIFTGVEEKVISVHWDGKVFIIYVFDNDNRWEPQFYFPKEFTDLAEVAKVLKFMLKELF